MDDYVERCQQSTDQKVQRIWRRICGEHCVASNQSVLCGQLRQFGADTSGNLTGYNNEELNSLTVEISDSFSGTYVVDPTGTGRVDSSISFNTNGPGPEFIFYLTGGGNPALVLDSDLNIGSLGAGVAYVQAAAPFSSDGSYGLDFTQSTSGLENDGTGEITVDGSASTLSGVVDTNLSFSPRPDTALTGNYDVAAGMLTNTFFPTPGTVPSALAVAFYLIDSSHGFFIESDSLLTGELSFGTFATRTPVCPNCLKSLRRTGTARPAPACNGHF
jgi:hypothetical protein